MACWCRISSRCWRSAPGSLQSVFSVEGRLELALGAIVFAALLDGIDGRNARAIKGQSKFGAELDSLADFVNFGVAPGLLALFLGAPPPVAMPAGSRRSSSRSAGGLKGSPASTPPWMTPTSRPLTANFFTGRAGASRCDLGVLLPVYLSFIGVWQFPALLTAGYTLAIGALMVSLLPVFSRKTMVSVNRGPRRCCPWCWSRSPSLRF